jgi:hypothetical protein
VHHAQNDWQTRIPDWSRRDSIRLLPISEQWASNVLSGIFNNESDLTTTSVGRTFRKTLNERADSAQAELYTAGLAYVPIDVHVPILDIPHLPVGDFDPSRMLTRAVIQGSFALDRRDYTAFFAEMISSLHGVSASRR